MHQCARARLLHILCLPRRIKAFFWDVSVYVAWQFTLFRVSSVAARAMAVRTPSPFDSPPVSPLSPRGPPRREILFESYLQKTPPLEKIFVVSIADIIVLACLYSPTVQLFQNAHGNGNACRVNDFIIESWQSFTSSPNPSLFRYRSLSRIGKFENLHLVIFGSCCVNYGTVSFKGSHGLCGLCRISGLLSATIRCVKSVTRRERMILLRKIHDACFLHCVYYRAGGRDTLFFQGAIR